MRLHPGAAAVSGNRQLRQIGHAASLRGGDRAIAREISEEPSLKLPSPSGGFFVR